MGLRRAAKRVGRFVKNNFNDIFRITLVMVAASAMAYGVDISPAVQSAIAATAVQRGLTAPAQVEELLGNYIEAKVYPDIQSRPRYRSYSNVYTKPYYSKRRRVYKYRKARYGSFYY